MMKMTNNLNMRYLNNNCRHGIYERRHIPILGIGESVYETSSPKYLLICTSHTNHDGSNDRTTTKSRRQMFKL